MAETTREVNRQFLVNECGDIFNNYWRAGGIINRLFNQIVGLFLVFAQICLIFGMWATNWYM